MGKIQIESGQSSSATHRITQTSTTLNRRYVRRPMNVAVEEAAREANQHREPVSTKPSRLVNMRIHAAEFEAARAKAEEEARRAAEAEEAARILAETNSVTLYPNVVEFGTNAADLNTMAPSQADTMTSPAMTPATPAMTTNVALNPFSTNSVTMPAATAAPATTTTPESAPVDMDALAMNIAADYAAASLGVSVKEYGNDYSGYAMPEPEQPATSLPASTDVSVDAIAQAASEAIASIRVATDPDQVSEQVASLQAFAEKIKTNHDSPEMKELGDTIEKFVNIAKKSTKVQEEAASKAKDKAAIKVSLPAKANRAAAKVTKSSAKVMAASRKKANLAATRSATPARPMMRRAAPAMSRRAPARSASPEELKNRAIEQALHSVATMDEGPESKSRPERLAPKRKLRARHFMVAFACAAACVAGIIYVVGANIPDISVRVAAMQTGIQATYPSYVPRDYSLKDVSSENGKISMRFDGPEKSSFTLVEEKSSWDSAALLRNYVEPAWGEDYATTHEQGITIYISNTTSDAAWVNGGVLYKITSTGTVLTKKQVRSIVTSL